MERLHRHQLRPELYYRIGFGWNTDRWYEHKIENRKTTSTF